MRTLRQDRENWVEGPFEEFFGLWPAWGFRTIAGLGRGSVLDLLEPRGLTSRDRGLSGGGGQTDNHTGCIYHTVKDRHGDYHAYHNCSGVINRTPAVLLYNLGESQWCFTRQKLCDNLYQPPQASGLIAWPPQKCGAPGIFAMGYHFQSPLSPSADHRPSLTLTLALTFATSPASVPLHSLLTPSPAHEVPKGALVFRVRNAESSPGKLSFTCHRWSLRGYNGTTTART